MDNKSFILLTKDAMCRDYLHIYGTKKGQFPTPNIDDLAEKGTVFYRYYTAAASTVMSFYSLAMRVYSYETDIQMYERVHKRIEGDTVFTDAKKYGYNNFHIIWSKGWETLPGYYDYFRNDVNIHTIENLRASTGIYKKEEGEIHYDEALALDTLKNVEDEVVKILSSNDSCFIWIHLPHVLNGCNGYGSDIELFDKYVGMIRKYVPDSSIAISADHGNMNGINGKLAYGFDLHDNTIRIPLITPRIGSIKKCNSLVSSLDLFTILYTGTFQEREIVFSETAYRAQKHRKLAIINNRFKYIYNKKTNTEELYDLEYDPNETISLMNDKYYDEDRKIYVDMSEEYYYPDWNLVRKVRQQMRAQKDEIWKNGDFSIIMKSNLKDLIRPFYERWIRYINR